MKPARIVQWSLLGGMIGMFAIMFGIVYSYNPTWAWLFALFLVWCGLGVLWSDTEKDRIGDLWLSCIFLAAFIVSEGWIKVIPTIVFLVCWISWLYDYLKEIKIIHVKRG